MMGQEKDKQGQLFYPSISFEARIPSDHLLRKISKEIDFNFVYELVKDTYGSKGNISVPPPVILKMMLLLVLYNIPSERELMRSIPLRIDWLWFLGYDLDDEIPNHSVLSKARRRWGVKVFKILFERIVFQCAKAGLVDGEKLFMDSSLVAANASNNSIVNTQQLEQLYLELETRLRKSSFYSLKTLSDEEKDKDKKKAEKSDISVNKKYSSKTDPDASVIRKGKGKPKLQYQIHRGIDERCGVITATKATKGEVNEAHLLPDLVLEHQKNTEQTIETVVADKKYGTINNYLYCHENGINAHIKPLEQSQKNTGRQKGIISRDEFIYNRDTDTFTCPAGHELVRKKYKNTRNHYEYQASKVVCANCSIRSECTRSKTGRTIKRHESQDVLDVMFERAYRLGSLSDIKKRQSFMEGNFAQGVKYGYKRSRWRGLWRNQIQEYLTASIQNMMILVRNKPYNICGARKRPDLYTYFLKMERKSRVFMDILKNIVMNIGNIFPIRIFQVEFVK